MMAQWRLFKVTLEQSLEKGDAPNEDDLRDHILEQLTPKLREQVLKHELKWRHQKFSVKVFVPPTIDWEELKTLFEEELGPTFDFESANLEHTRQGFCFECSSEKIRQRALDLSGMHQSNAPPIRVVSETRERMPRKDLVKKIEDILREEEELRLANPVVEEVALPSPKATWSKEPWSKAEPQWPRRPSPQQWQGERPREWQKKDPRSGKSSTPQKRAKERTMWRWWRKAAKAPHHQKAAPQEVPLEALGDLHSPHRHGVEISTGGSALPAEAWAKNLCTTSGLVPSG